MSGDNWQVGDLALCVLDKPCGVFGPVSLIAGHTYIVADVRHGACKKTGLIGTGLRILGNADTPPWHHEKRFQKLPPLTDSEKDEFIRELLTDAPLRETVHG